ncbi:MAG: hypothetical protein ACD_45C00112G0002 [uncultured bacterium]|nr:MAG: hypothetical protein ACD_45C00112G0002 [uncultured bacterium]OGT55794.1 MAG: hypothetical protein A3F43_06095 [Gammaproteobacteria bacterium RIFCSPHIGHO2_12_FULL_42_10]
MFVRDDTWNAVKQFPAETIRCHMPLCIGYKEDHYTPSELLVLANDMSQRGYDFAIYLVPNDKNREMVLQKWYADNAELVGRYPVNIKIISEWRRETPRWKEARDALLPVLDLVSSDFFDETVPSAEPAHVLASHLRADIDKKGVRARFPDETDARIYAHMIDEMADCVAFMVPRLHEVTKPVLICNSATIHIQAIIKAMLTNKLLSKQQLFLKCVQTHIVHPDIKSGIKTSSGVQLQKAPHSPTVSDSDLSSVRRRIAEQQLEALLRSHGIPTGVSDSDLFFVQRRIAEQQLEALLRSHGGAPTETEIYAAVDVISALVFLEVMRHHTPRACYQPEKPGNKLPLSNKADDKHIQHRSKSVGMFGKGSEVFVPITAVTRHSPFTRHSPYYLPPSHGSVDRRNSSRLFTSASSFKALKLQQDQGKGNAATADDPVIRKTPSFL